MNKESKNMYTRKKKRQIYEQKRGVLSTRIRGYFYNEMRYINLRFTYLLTLSYL